MGAGKTTIARALARRLGWKALDIDDAIEQREHQTVAALFAKRGEAHFRTVERAVLMDQVSLRHLVVATGGGTFVDQQNRALINADGVSVWLDVPLERLVARVPADGRRPLAADRAAFEQLYVTRRSAYEQATFRIDAARAGIEAIAEEILDRLAQEHA
jgi:shikimate kinase